MLAHSQPGRIQGLRMRALAQLRAPGRGGRRVHLAARARCRPRRRGRRRPRWPRRGVSCSISSFRSCGSSSRMNTGRSSRLDGQHALAQVRRQVARAVDDAHRVVVGHACVRVRGRGRGHGLLDVDQAVLQLVAALLADRQHHGVAQQAERTASLHPVGRVEHGRPALVVARAEQRDQARHRLLLEQPRRSRPSRPAPASRSACRWARAGTTSSKRSRARCFHERRSASFITRWTGAGSGASTRRRRAGEAGAIAPIICFQHHGRRDAGQVGAARGHRQRQPEADQVVRGVADRPSGPGRGSGSRRRPCTLAIGPRLPRWQSPQIQIAGPAGSDSGACASSHS